MTQQFLDFSAARGNDLRRQAGLRPGQKWCLCAGRWKEAYDARQGDEDPVVPQSVWPPASLFALGGWVGRWTLG